MSADPPDGPADGPPDRTGPDLARAALARVRAAARERGQRAGSAAGRWRTRSARDPGRSSGAHPDDRDPQRLAATLHRLIGDRGWEPTLQTAGVMGRWETLVGREVAEHCRPERFDDGLLVLVAESTAWATQLRMLGPQIAKRVNEGIGARVVQRVTVHGPATPSWRHGPRRVLGRGPRDTYG